MGSNLTKNQEFIAKKYEKTRRVRVASFRVGDRVEDTDLQQIKEGNHLPNLRPYTIFVSEV